MLNQNSDFDLSHLDLDAAEKAAEEKSAGGGEVLPPSKDDNDCGGACSI